jgi:hypothetical protein
MSPKTHRACGAPLCVQNGLDLIDLALRVALGRTGLVALTGLLWGLSPGLQMSWGGFGVGIIGVAVMSCRGHRTFEG